ncbi:hypothetical protein RIR_jg5125.t1 [Rhizophagus irregularis DAOM 181602=DAOM 197198]|uniref:Uncharacterized protein n=1 Tax=Rhizophagus irregularis (strain DAOM 197198w) TaxID=1432141 RepID=A0A015JT24_RHIIW
MKVLNLSESLLSNLLSDWEVLEPPVEDACTQLQWWCLWCYKYFKDENPFLDFPPTEIITADNVVQYGNYKYPDVYYIIELLRYT